jgi:hypothetical protein
MWMLLAAAITCAPISTGEGAELIMLAPKVIAVQSKPGVRLIARFMRLEDGQRLYRVSDSARPEGALIGWYSVDLYSYLVRNWTAPGWPVETSPAIEAAQRRLTETHCRR